MSLTPKWATVLSCIILCVSCNRVKTPASVDSDSNNNGDSTDNSDSTDNPQTTDSGGAASDESTVEVIEAGTEAVGSCSVDWKTTASAFEPREFDGVDIVLVVDNTASMIEEHQILATSIYSLVKSLANPVPGMNLGAVKDIRIGITTSDMGVSYNGAPYEEREPNFPLFANPQVRCEGMGDNGEFQTDYYMDEVVLQEGVIACTQDAIQCPPDWTCERLDGSGVGKCMNPAGADVPVPCPLSPDDQYQDYVTETRDNAALVAACLVNVGLDGCNYEQQLAAGAAGLESNLDTFLRPGALTVIMVVSDEADCSLESNEWHELDEVQNVTANLACGRHPEYLIDVAEIKDRYTQAVFDAKGDVGGVIFAAIVGVPYSETDGLSECEGLGTTLGDCGDTKPGVNGKGTMSEPDEVARMTSAGVDQYYFEYACERYADDAAPGDRAVTAAYPGMRYVEMARLFGESGYVYSICHEDWTPAMTELASMIAGNLDGTCYDAQLEWEAATETANCDLVFDYYYSKSDLSAAPLCPEDDGQQWADDGTVSVVSSMVGDTTVEYWKRSCPVKKLPAPYFCDDLSYDGFAQYMLNEFGWFYCEDRTEDNYTACGDGLDNDRDGLIDHDDPNCSGCLKGMGFCGSACPHQVSLTNKALSEALTGYVKAINVVCKKYVPSDNNPDECYENRFRTCNDGIDNDLDGNFDCWSYGKAEVDAIPEAHFPSAGARRADGGCCPMSVSNDGANRCEFLNGAGAPVSDMAQAAYTAFCSTDSLVSQFPDACCIASLDLNCALPNAIREECQSRGF